MLEPYVSNQMLTKAKFVNIYQPFGTNASTTALPLSSPHHDSIPSIYSLKHVTFQAFFLHFSDPIHVFFPDLL